MADRIDIGAEAESPVIRALDLSAFGRADLVNIILQRSEVIFDLPRPGQVIRSWTEGDNGPIEAAVDVLGETIARRAAGVIHAEYKALSALITGLRPARLADIGCGYAFFDLFAARETGCDLVLIDLEQNDARHFGFKQSASAYSSLNVARRMLEANGVAAGRIRALNPEREDIGSVEPVDVAVSFLSCGFHFPVDGYMPFFASGVAPDGVVMVDLRQSTADAQMQRLAALGSLQTIAGPDKARRVILRKTKG